jgi:hypothetical protein
MERQLNLALSAMGDIGYNPPVASLPQPMGSTGPAGRR